MTLRRWLFLVLALSMTMDFAMAEVAAPPSPADPTKPIETPTAAPAETKPAPVPAAKPAPAATDAVVLDATSLEAVIGRSAKSPTGEDMGRIVDMLVTSTGGVRAAVIDFGGFLGVGSRKIAVDWKALNFADVAKSGNVIVTLTRNQVRMAPEYKQGDPIVVLETTTPETASPAPAKPDAAKPDAQQADGAKPDANTRAAPASPPTTDDTQKK